MPERPDCARTDHLIPELAIGVAAGDERAQALGHLARCLRCRGELESATAAADALLLLAPEHEPPPGFESRVLAGVPGQASREPGGPRDPGAPPEPPELSAPPEPPGSLGSTGSTGSRAGAAPGRAPALRRPGGTGRRGRAGRPGRAGRRVRLGRRTAPPWHGAPSRTEPPRTEPSRTGPSRTGSAQAGFAHTGPARTGPVRNWPSPRAGPRARRWRRALLRTAVTVTIAGLVGGALWWRTDDDRQLAASYRATLAIAHGRYLRAAPLLAEGTVPAGHMFAYEGKPSWILVIVRTRNVSGGFVVQLVTRNGLVLPLGSMTVRHGEGSWGSTISIPVDRIAAVTLSSPRSPAITGRLGS